MAWSGREQSIVSPYAPPACARAHLLPHGSGAGLDSGSTAYAIHSASPHLAYIMPGGAARNLRNIDNNSDNLDNTVKVPEWNTSSLNLPTFINDLGEWLYAENVRFKRLIEDGTAIDKRSVCCESQHHIDKIVTKTFTKGTFQEPAFGPPDPSAVPVAPAATPGAAAPADETPAGGVTVSITSSSPAAPVTAASAISSPSSRFTIFPEGIEELDNKMFNTIAECIKDPSTVKKLKRECKQSGRLLLVYLHAKEKKGVSDGMYNALQSEYARAVKADIGAPTIAAFNAYKSEIERCHDVLPPGLQDKDAVRAQPRSRRVRWSTATRRQASRRRTRTATRWCAR